MLPPIAAETVRDRQEYHGDRECEQDRHQPRELHAVGVPIDVGKPFQHIDRRNRDDGTKDLLLQARESDADQTGRPARPSAPTRMAPPASGYRR
jgi:hypothetical protein